MTKPPPGGSNAQVSELRNEIDQIRANLRPLQRLRAIDPDVTSRMETERTAPASPTGGPNRLTLYVPTEHTILSLGQGCAERINDYGLTGSSDNHVHFEVTPNNQTVVSLGDPATSVCKSNFHGDDLVSALSYGYAMLTDGNAWHESQSWHTVMSVTKDTAIVAEAAGRRAVLQATHGIVDINAAQHVSIATDGVSICAQPGLLYENPNYGTDWTGVAGKSSVAQFGRAAAMVGDAIMVLSDYVFGFKKNFTKGEHGKRGWTTDDAHIADAVKWALDGGKQLLAAGKMKKLFSEDPSAPPSGGSVKVAATNDVGIVAGGHASLFGQMTVGVSSALSASLFSVLLTSVKGLVFAGLSGAYASVKGIRQVKIGADAGKVAIGAHTDVNIDAHGSVKITAKKDAQLNADKNAYVYGQAGATVSAGPGDGFSLFITGDTLQLGRASQVHQFDGPGHQKDELLEFKKNTHIDMVFKDTSVFLQQSLLKLESPEIKMLAKSGGNVTVNGAKILLE